MQILCFVFGRQSVNVCTFDLGFIMSFHLSLKVFCVYYISISSRAYTILTSIQYSDYSR